MIPQLKTVPVLQSAHSNKPASWWERKKANSKFVNAVANNPVSKVLSYGSNYNCHAVVTVSTPPPPHQHSNRQCVVLALLKMDRR